MVYYAIICALCIGTSYASSSSSSSYTGKEPSTAVLHRVDTVASIVRLYLMRINKNDVAFEKFNYEATKPLTTQTVTGDRGNISSGFDRNAIRVVKDGQYPFFISLGASKFFKSLPREIQMRITRYMSGFLACHFPSSSARYTGAFLDNQGNMYDDINGVKSLGNYIATRHYVLDGDDDEYMIWRLWSEDLRLIGIFADERAHAFTDINDIKLLGNYIITQHDIAECTQVARLWTHTTQILFRDERGRPYTDIGYIGLVGDYIETGHGNGLIHKKSDGGLQTRHSNGLTMYESASTARLWTKDIREIAFADERKRPYKNGRARPYTDISGFTSIGNFIATQHLGRARLWTKDMRTVFFRNEQGHEVENIREVLPIGDYIMTRHGLSAAALNREMSLREFVFLESHADESERYCLWTHDLRPVLFTDGNRTYTGMGRIKLIGNYIATQVTFDGMWLLWSKNGRRFAFKDPQARVYNDIKNISAVGDFIVTRHTGAARLWTKELDCVGTFKDEQAHECTDINSVSLVDGYMVTSHYGSRDELSMGAHFYRLWTKGLQSVVLRDEQANEYSHIKNIRLIRDYVLTEHHNDALRLWTKDLCPIVLADTHGKPLGTLVSVELVGDYIKTKHRRSDNKYTWCLWSQNWQSISLLKDKRFSDLGAATDIVSAGKYILTRHGMSEMGDCWLKRSVLLAKGLDKLVFDQIVFLAAAVQRFFSEERAYNPDGTYTVTRHVRIGGTGSVSAEYINELYHALPEPVQNILQGYRYQLPKSFLSTTTHTSSFATTKDMR